MRSEKQIRKKYEEMLEHSLILIDKVSNPWRYEDINVDNIHEHIRNRNEQYNLIALIEWILDKDRCGLGAGIVLKSETESINDQKT